MPNLFPRAQTGRHLYCWYAPCKRIHAVPNSFMLNFPFLWWTLQLLNLAKLDGFSSTQVTQWAVSTSAENLMEIILHIIIIIIGSSSSICKIMTAVPWVSWSAIITRSATSLCNQTSAVLNTHIRSMRNNIKCEQTFKSWYLTSMSIPKTLVSLCSSIETGKKREVKSGQGKGRGLLFGRNSQKILLFGTLSLFCSFLRLYHLVDYKMKQQV